ncbi:DedA family protein [Actinobaculum suis]|uniref:DedA family protein n=1 Tax=Actinobaculum suis TaxID=1657 RepID=UPI00066FD6AB|nr:VTT domain-containing protein [Actinobaculum suis]
MDGYSFLAGKPFIIVYLVLFLVVSLRSTATFWLGRYAAYLVLKQKEPSNRIANYAWSWAHNPKTLAAADRIQRRGWPLVTLCFYTIGIQTVILIGAGLTRMRAWRFTAAAFFGWVGWALIYSTVGMAALAAVWSAILGSWWGIGIIAVLIIAAGSYVFMRRHRRTQRIKNQDATARITAETENPDSAISKAANLATADTVAQTAQSSTREAPHA